MLVKTTKYHKMQEPYWWEHTFCSMVGEASCDGGGGRILIGTTCEDPTAAGIHLCEGNMQDLDPQLSRGTVSRRGYAAV